MRLSSVTPASAEEIRDAVAEEIEALAPGMRIVATSIPIADRGVIDLLASDGRGRLAIVTFALEADAAAVSRAIDQWDWTAANLGLLRALAPAAGLDLAREPALMLVAGAVPEETRRLAGSISRPGIDLYEAILVAAESSRGVLLRPVEPALRPAADEGIDRALGAFPPGEARSLVRRLVEEARDALQGAGRLEAARVEGAVDLRIDGAPIASIVCADGIVEARLPGPGGPVRVSDDAGCREAARTLAGRFEGAPGRASGRAGSPPGAPEAALTPEEIAEFGRLGRPEGRGAERTAAAPAPAAPAGSAVEASPEPASGEPPAVRILKTGFMEN